jgi:hypothetical protein
VKKSAIAAVTTVAADGEVMWHSPMESLSP